MRLCSFFIFAFLIGLAAGCGAMLAGDAGLALIFFVAALACFAGYGACDIFNRSR